MSTKSSLFKPGEERAREAGRKGAKAKHRRQRATMVRTVAPEDAPALPQTVEDAVRYVAWLCHSVTTGVIDARTCKEASAALHVFIKGQQGLDRSDEKVKALQAQLAELLEKTRGRS
jgi:hypothetical protein